MLGRRHLRAKVMQGIYAYNSSEENMLAVEKNMFHSIDKIFDLYIYSLNFLTTLHDFAINRIEIRKQKKLATSDDINPNTRFIDNPILIFISNNPSIKSYTAKNTQLTWDITDKYISEIFETILASRTFKNYLALDNPAFIDHKKFILNIYKKYIAPNEKLASWYEDYEISWYDDYHITNSMVYKTIERLEEEDAENFKLFSVYKDQEDKAFTKELYRKTIHSQKENKLIIDEKTKNWDIERIASIDLIILEMALTEFKEFGTIPPKVTLNEYIEIAKDYSTENSKIFINGVLNQIMKEFERTNQFNKSGRGLI